MKLREKIYQLAGDDPALIQKCTTKTQAQFLEIGLFVPLLFVLCLLSSYSTFSELFQTPLLTFALALFFTWMLTNIYSLLLYTITRSALPDTTQTSYSLFSLGIRMAFVCFISLIVSMPIECVLYSTVLDKDMVKYKAEAKALIVKNTNCIL